MRIDENRDISCPGKLLRSMSMSFGNLVQTILKYEKRAIWMPR